MKTYNSGLELLHELRVAAHLLVTQVGGDLGHCDRDVTVGLEHGSLNVTDELAHVMGNFLLGLHRGDVDLFEHESEACKTGLGLPTICTDVVFLGHLFNK